MKASLQVKNGKYYAVLSYKDEFGQDKRKWIATGYEEKGNKRKAEQKLSEILQKYKDNENLIETHTKPTNDIPLSEYLNQWYQSRKNEVEELTFESYGFVIRKMSKYFAKNQITLNELKPYDIQTYYNTLYKEGRTGNTVMHYHVVLREALQNAIKLGLISKNVADFVDRPKKEKFHSDFYNKDELKQLFEVIKGDPLELIIHITAYYGLRRSEVLGLKWSSIDFNNKIIKINHKVVSIKGKLICKNKMKNKTSNRTLPLIPHIEEMLLNEKERQRKNKELCGDAYDNRYLDYVCVNDIGTLYYPDYLSQHFRVIQKQNNLKLIRFHDLRHSCASLMLANGVQMKQIQEWLGHSTYNTTADIYAHLDYSSKIASANVISGVLDFENNSNLSDKEVLENEIAKLEKQLKEKKKLRKTKDFEM